jgi:hypothetical protein
MNSFNKILILLCCTVFCLGNFIGQNPKSLYFAERFQKVGMDTIMKTSHVRFGIFDVSHNLDSNGHCQSLSF